MPSAWIHKWTSGSFKLTTAPFMVTIISVSSFQEVGANGTSSNVSSVCMIHAQIPNLMLQNILTSRCVGCYIVLRETLSCIVIHNGIWASMSKALDFRVDTRISFGLRSKMQVMVSNLMLFFIVATRTLFFVSIMTYLTKNIIFVRPVIESFWF